MAIFGLALSASIAWVTDKKREDSALSRQMEPVTEIEEEEEEAERLLTDKRWCQLRGQFPDNMKIKFPVQKTTL